MRWPSAELKAPAPGKGRVVAAMWWLLFALAVFAIGAGVWQSIETFRKPNGFDLAGLTVESTDGCIRVTPATYSAKAAWPDGADSTLGACIVAVNGAEAHSGVARATVESWLHGEPGERVTVALASDRELPGAAVEFPLMPTLSWGAVGMLIADTLAVALYAAVAFLLWRKRGLDPVSRRISFAFLLVAHLGVGPSAFWLGIDFPFHYMLGFVGVLVVIVTLPAYPNGVYVPRMARWLRVVVPLGTIAAILIESFAPGGAGTMLLTIFILVLLPAGLLLLGLRYYRMPAGLEKQQIKWAVLGICAGFVLMLAGASISDPKAFEATPGSFAFWTGLSQVIGELGFAAIPAGVGISLFEYRLNDADAAVGKSLGYAIITIVVGVVWAIVQSVVGDFARSWAGNQAVTSAITTVIAALVFTPARTYVLSWTEKKFQPALVRLRKLPEKLDRWQTCHSPDELAGATLDDLVKGVGAAYAAILGDDGREWRVLAANGVEPDTAMAQLSAERPANRREDPFPIRRELADQLGRPDILGIGPRSDGASFTGDEKAAIALILEPLSNALQASALRERHIIKVENSLVGIDERLGRLEIGLATSRRPSG